MRTKRVVNLGLMLGIVTGSLACDRKESPREYTVVTATQPSNAPAAPSAPAMPAPNNPPMTGPGAPAITPPPPVQSTEGLYVLPAGWTQLPNRPMRVATFESTRGEARIEIALSQFPGDVGGVLANVNRWRQQVGLGPVAEKDLEKELASFKTAAMQGYTMRLKGASQHMLAAIISEHAADRTWFVKATTTSSGADAHEADVIAFARSFGASAAPATQPK